MVIVRDDFIVTGGTTTYSKMYESGDYDEADPSDSYYTAGGDYSQGGNYSAGTQAKLIPSNTTTDKKTTGNDPPHPHSYQSISSHMYDDKKVLRYYQK